MSSRSLSFGWCLTLGALVVGLAAGCGGSSTPPLPPAPDKQLPDATKSTVEVDKTANVVANGKEAVTITVTVRRSDDTVLADRTVTLEVTGEGTTVTPASGQTDANGVMKATLVSNRAGEKRVTARVDADGGPVTLGTVPVVVFVAPQVAKLAFTSTRLQATAGSPLNPVLEVALQDAEGNTVRDATNTVAVELASGPADATLDGTLSVNAVNGVARFPEVVLKKAGTGYVLRAKSGALTTTSSTFDVVPAAAARLELTGLPPTLTAGGSASVEVVLHDAFGNLATNHTGTVRFSSSDPSAVLPADYAFTAQDAGRKFFTGLSLRSAGTQTVTVADTVNLSVKAEASVQVGAGNASRLVFVQQPGNRSVRANLGTIQVALTDEYGNPTAVSEPQVTVKLSKNEAALGGVTTVAPVDGVAFFDTLSVSQEDAGYTLIATANGIGTAATSTAFTIVDDVSPQVPVLTQGTTTSNSIVVQWTAVGDDGMEGTATSQELRYSTTNIVTDTDFNNATPVTTGAPQVAGSAESATLSGLTPGTNYYVALKVTDNAGNSVRSATRPMSTNDPVVAQLAFTVQPVGTTAGMTMADVKVALQDADGNTVTTSTLAVNLDLVGGPPFPQRTENAEAGVATFSNIIINKAGTNYRFEASSGSLPTTQSNPFTISPAAAARLDMVGLVAPVTAGVPGSLEVTAYDAFDNVATGYTGTVAFTSTDSNPSLPANYTFTAGDAGQKAFTGVVLRTAGEQKVRVQDTQASGLQDELTVQVVSGTAEQLVLTLPAGPVTAGASFTLTVTLRDGVGNIATGYRGTVAFTSNSANPNLPANYTFTESDAGTKTFTNGAALFTAGTPSITAQDTQTPALTDTESITVTPGVATKLALVAPDAATAGASFSVTVSARDDYDNVAPSYRGTVQLSSDDPKATVPGPYTFTEEDAGSRTLNVTLGTVGTQPVRVTDGTFTASDLVAVGAGPAVRLGFTGLAASVTAGASNDVTVTAYDAFDNVATGYTGTVTFTSSDSNPTLPSPYTFVAGDQGTQDFSVVLRTAGSRTVSVEDTGLGGAPVTLTTTVNAAAPDRLVFLQQPANGTVRASLAEVRVALQDPYGNATTATSPDVTLALSGGTPGAGLSGAGPVTPANGEASFTTLQVDQEGTGYQLVASGFGLTGATSTAFNIQDNLAPAQAVLSGSATDADSVTLTWTAVGDDGTQGQAASYELRYATTPITNETEFDNATVYALPTPQPAGATELAVVDGLPPAPSYYFALKVYDGAGNFSRSASAKVDLDPCAGVTCLPTSACTADGTSVQHYTSACVVQDGAGVCQDTPSTTTRCQSYETCNTGACVPVTAGSQAGNIIISEFRSLGAEFIELRNTTAADIDVHGYTFRNAAGQEADIRAKNDPNGTGGTPVTVPAGGVLYGIANPSGAIPPEVGFVYGAPGTAFALADAGDALAIYTRTPGNLEDAVDFRTFNANPNTVVTASTFIGFAGSSTQLDPESLTAAGNDTATNWCVSFYPAGSRGARITHTLGADNGSCKVAVINEFVYDNNMGGDDSRVFVEIAGPGGSVIGGAKLVDVEGKGTGTSGAGSRNASPSFGEVTLPAGTRIPADGILLVADSGPGGTEVPNFVPGVDVSLPNIDAEDGGGDSLQLVSAGGALLDVLGQDPAGAAFATNTAFNGLAMYEGATALSPTTTAGNVVPSLSRSPESTDTDNNASDFRADPSWTPGLPNDAVNFTVTGMTPDDTPATAGFNGITVTGTDFSPGFRAKFGNGPLSTCNLVSSTTATCNALPNPGGVGTRVNVVFSNPTNVKATDVTLVNGFTYTGKKNDPATPDALEADYCNLQFPASFSVVRSTPTPLIYGRIYEAGVTEAPGASSGVLAEVGYGTSADPTTSSNWRFFAASYNVQDGNNDEYSHSFTAPATAGTYLYTYRFSFDGGLYWTYCDTDGAGSDPGLTFETTAGKLGTMTVTTQ